MRDFQNAYPNDYYSEFDRRYRVGQIIIMVGEKPRRDGEE